MQFVSPRTMKDQCILKYSFYVFFVKSFFVLSSNDTPLFGFSVDNSWISSSIADISPFLNTIKSAFLEEITLLHSFDFLSFISFNIQARMFLLSIGTSCIVYLVVHSVNCITHS